jgi:Zn-dependent protease with chaperone function
MNLRRFALLLCLLLPFALIGCASETPAEHVANVYAQQELDAAPVHGNLPDYSLSPADLAKAQHLSTIRVTMHFVEEAWGIISLVLLLFLGVIGWMRDVAVKISRFRWIQGFTFLFLYLLIGTLVSLPLDLYTQHLQLEYGLSVQNWGSWFGDQAKGFGIAWLIGGLMVMVLFWIIRRAPRTWWLIFWGFAIPMVLLGIVITPWVIEPLFDKYEPLAKTNPALVARLEQVVAKTHMDIPPERMFMMKASEKVTTLNADVEGFGPSKRVVVWDTSIAKATPDQIVGIFGHESGHYALGHIEQLVFFLIGTLLVELFLGYLFVQWAIAKFGARWGVPAQTDWAALAVLLLAFSIFSLLTEPIQSSFVRMHEHDADVYGQEVVHGLVADPQATMQSAFDLLGKLSYADPNPSQFYEFWTYSHPSIGRRAAFAKVYDPWAPGVDPKYFKK